MKQKEESKVLFMTHRGSKKPFFGETNGRSLNYCLEEGIELSKVEIQKDRKEKR